MTANLVRSPELGPHSDRLLLSFDPGEIQAAATFRAAYDSAPFRA